MSIVSVMLSNHLILCHPLFLLPSTLPIIRVFSNELALHITWSKYWSFCFSNSPSKEYSGLTFFRIDWFDLLVVQGTLESSPAPLFKSINSSALSLLFWRRGWQSTPVFLPGESHGQRSLAGYSPWGHKELDKEWLSTAQYIPPFPPSSKVEGGIPMLIPENSMSSGKWFLLHQPATKMHFPTKIYWVKLHDRALAKLSLKCNVD